MKGEIRFTHKLHIVFSKAYRRSLDRRVEFVLWIFELLYFRFVFRQCVCVPTQLYNISLLLIIDSYSNVYI